MKQVENLSIDETIQALQENELGVSTLTRKTTKYVFHFK